MDHVIGSAACGLNILHVGDRAHAKIDFPANALDVRLLPGGKIVQNNHVLAAADEFIDHMGADETRAACYQIAHRGQSKLAISVMGSRNDRVTNAS